MYRIGIYVFLACLSLNISRAMASHGPGEPLYPSPNEAKSQPHRYKKKYNAHKYPPLQKNQRNYSQKNYRLNPSQWQARLTPVSNLPRFDIPVTYNEKVKKWVKYFKTRGKPHLTKWISRSFRYRHTMQQTFRKKGLPEDLFYIALIESGLSPRATSSAQAVGYWQFIKPTAHRYGLQVNWWLDERRDFSKSTHAAASYLGDLYEMFGSWYLAAAAYNMGEGRLKRLIKRHNTNNFWHLAQKKSFPRETKEYIPKLIAAMLIAKSPKLYGFKTIKPMVPHKYEFFQAPGGTDLVTLAHYLGIHKSELAQLNPELTKGFIPPLVETHKIRIPRGYTSKVSQYVRRYL